jgi:hypothetical protein
VTRSLTAGFMYFAIVFAVGFVLGIGRVLVLVPRLGELGSAFAELPIILSASWVICGRLIDRYSVPGDWQSRLVMGGVAFALLMIAELCVSVLAFSRSLEAHMEAYQSWNALLGLAGQIAFAAFPLLRLSRT